MMIRQRSAISAAVALVCLSSGAQATLSTFDDGFDGWVAAGDSLGPIAFSASEGNPGGHIIIIDAQLGPTTYFVAPAVYLGNQIAALGSQLAFDFRQDYRGPPSAFDDDDVVLQGNGLTIAYDLSISAANGVWNSYAVPLSAAGWRLGTFAGPAVTAGQFASVLSGLTALRIRAEYQSGFDVGRLDNVSLVPEPNGALLAACGLIALLGRAASRKR